MSGWISEAPSDTQESGTWVKHQPGFCKWNQGNCFMVSFVHAPEHASACHPLQFKAGSYQGRAQHCNKPTRALLTPQDCGGWMGTRALSLLCCCQAASHSPT